MLDDRVAIRIAEARLLRDDACLCGDRLGEVRIHLDDAVEVLGCLTQSVCGEPVPQVEASCLTRRYDFYVPA